VIEVSQYLIQYGIIFLVLVFILLIVLKATKKDFHVEANKLIDYLGGKDNIISMEVNMSRFKVTLRDVSIVNKEGIQKMGAKGIVEIDNQLKIILGPNAKQLEKYIDDLKK
jgi:PTS system N-acetylglucosamine-specific IIC component